jgi:hypothetical protein
MSISNGNKIEIRCIKEDCGSDIGISLLEMEKKHRVQCGTCKNEYSFNKHLLDQIRKFERLVSAILDAKDILGQTAVALDIQGHSVKIPYKLLLTRLNSELKLKINDEEIKVKFRVEPLEEQILK